MQGTQRMQGIQIGFGRRRLVLAMVAREAPAPVAGPATPVDAAAGLRRERWDASRRLEQDRAAARAMGWWYGLYGTGR